VGALGRHAAIHRQGTEEGDEHEDERRDRRERTGRERRDAGLVAEGREVVDTCQAHDPPPRLHVLLGLGLALRLVVAARVGLLGVEEPPLEGCALQALCRHGGEV
jgi:hypothetical protein